MKPTSATQLQVGIQERHHQSDRGACSETGWGFYYLTTVKPILNGQNEVISVICISKEITERKRMEQELHHLSSHDILTGLYNRNSFEVGMAGIQISRLSPSAPWCQMWLIWKLCMTVTDTRAGHGYGSARMATTGTKVVFHAEAIVARIVRRRIRHPAPRAGRNGHAGPSRPLPRQSGEARTIL